MNFYKQLSLISLAEAYYLEIQLILTKKLDFDELNSIIMPLRLGIGLLVEMVIVVANLIMIDCSIVASS